MRLKVGFSWCRVEESSETEDRFLKNFLGFTVKGRFGVSKTESLYFPKSKIFPAGLASLVVRSARNQGYSVEVSNRTPLIPLLTSDFYTSSLWPHQREGILKALEQKRGILQHATGTGKGSLISYLCKILPGRVLVVVTSKQLLHEMYDRIKLWVGEAPGRVGGGFRELGKRIIVCVQASLKSLPKRLLDAFAAIIGDECFPAGVMVGDHPIENISVGDSVPSWDELTGSLTHRRVTRLFKHKPSALVRVSFRSGKSIVCTPGHPFYTERGWVLALALSGRSVLSTDHANSAVFPMQDGRCTNDQHVQSTESVLQELQIASQEREAEKSQTPLHDLRDDCSPPRTPWFGASEERASLLLRGAQEAVSLESGASECPQSRRPELTTSIGAYESAKSDVQSGDTSKTVLDIEKNRAQASCARRKWAGHHHTTSTHGSGTLVGDGSDSSHQSQERGWDSNTLQARCGKQRVAIRGGSEWIVPQQPICQSQRSEKGNIPSWDRVDRVEFLEPGSDGTFGGLCKEGVVYNLEVEGTHTYTANGFVVHNCHGASARSYWEPLMKCTNAGIRIGLSGTPLEREDKRHLHIVGLFGEILHKYTPKQAADDKITAKATLKIVKSKVPLLYAEKHAEAGNYVEWDKWAIASNRTRNLKIVDLLARTDIPFPKILFVRTLFHQEILRKQYGLSESSELRYVNHTTPIEELAKIKAGIEDGTVEILISGPIFRQGVDMKRIATIINAAGGKCTVDVIQKAGRGSRRLQDDGSHKENFMMIDFEDRGCDTPCPHKTCEWLRRHSKLRQTAYKKFGYNPQEFQ